MPRVGGALHPARAAAARDAVAKTVLSGWVNLSPDRAGGAGGVVMVVFVMEIEMSHGRADGRDRSVDRVC